MSAARVIIIKVWSVYTVEHVEHVELDEYVGNVEKVENVEHVEHFEHMVKYLTNEHSQQATPTEARIVDTTNVVPSNTRC